MPLLSGPDQAKMVSELQAWMNETIQFLVDALTEDFPLGSIKLSPMEQLARYRERRADPQQMQAMIQQLEARYRGLPDSRQRVEADLQSYVKRMDGLEAKFHATGSLDSP